MDKQSQFETNENKSSAEPKGVITAGKDLANETMDSARERWKSARESGGKLMTGLREGATDQAQNVDRVVREYPYWTIAIAASLGALLGCVLARNRAADE